MHEIIKKLTEKARVLRSRLEELKRRKLRPKRMENALHESVQFTSSLLNNSPHPIIVTNLDNSVRYVNPAMEKLTGFSSRELIGSRPPYPWWTKETPKKNSKDSEQDLCKGAQRVEELFRKKNGDRFRVQITSTPVKKEGQVKYYVANWTDVTECRKAEEQARRSQAELERAFRIITIGEMAADIVHELKGPLTAIQIYADGCLRMIKENKTVSGQLVAAVEHTTAQANRAGEIIRRVGSLVSKHEPRQSMVGVNDIIREVISLEKAEAGHKAIAIQVELTEGMPLILADSIQIEQVILNLVRNAFEAMSDTATGQRHLTIQSSTAGGNSIEVAVSDTGKGLPPEGAEKVFDSFFTTKPEGLGIGLSISRAIIEAHGGHLWAEPNAGSGVTFRFTLPIKGA